MTFNNSGIFKIVNHNSAKACSIHDKKYVVQETSGESKVWERWRIIALEDNTYEIMSEDPMIVVGDSVLLGVAHRY
jgi:hypothetical protein